MGAGLDGGTSRRDLTSDDIEVEARDGDSRLSYCAVREEKALFGKRSRLKTAVGAGVHVESGTDGRY